MNLEKEVKRLLMILTLILIPIQLESQTVLKDSINKTVTLDKKATIAIGNYLKQRDSLLQINYDQQRLIDSLRKEANNYRKEADTLRSVNRNLRFALNEKDIQLNAKIDILDLNDKLNEAKLNALKRKRLGLGLSIGYGLTNESTTIFTGISLNYNLIRF